MQEQLEMTVTVRTETGKGPAGRLRRDGKFPAVLYGKGKKGSTALVFDTKVVEKAIHGHSGGNVLINLDIVEEGPEEGKGEGKSVGKKTVMFKIIDRHPVSGAIEHADLVEINLKKKVIVEVPVNIIGKSEGVTLGGILQQEHREIQVECLPGDIPDSIDVDVTELGLGQSLHVGEITLPEGLTVIGDEKAIVVSVVIPAAEEEEKTTEEAEAELAESFEEKDKEEEEGKEEEGKKEEEKKEE